MMLFYAELLAQKSTMPMGRGGGGGGGGGEGGYAERSIK